MAIKIKRNDSGNCITFEGSSNPVYWNACLSAEVDPIDSTRVNVINDIKTRQLDNGDKAYEFFKIPYTEFIDADGNAFANAQATADYITINGNVSVGIGVTYKGVWDANTNAPDITTDTSGFALGDFYKLVASGTYDFGNGDVDFINGDEVIWNGTEWDRKPYAGALIEYDSTSILLNNNAAVYADGAQGLEEPNGAEDGWYFKNDEAGKKINWYFLGNENAGYQMNKATLEGGYARIKVLTPMGTDSPFMSLYTTPKGDGFDAYWFRSRYSYIGDFTGISANQEVIIYWGEDPSVHPELTRVQLSLDSFSTLLSTAPDISTDEIYTMALGTNSSATVDSIEFIAKELGYKNQQYLRSYLLEAKLENIVVPQNDNDLTGEAVDFKLDATSTSIMLNNGYAYGVNTIKAVDTGDGLITIKSIQGDLEHWIKLDHTNVTVDGSSVSGGLNDVINTLNELYTVGAFESVVISDPYSTMVADVDGVDIVGNIAGAGGVDPIGADIAGGTASSSNNAGYLSNDTIDQAGEYFTFDIRNEGTIGFGLVHTTDSYDDGYYSGNSTYANPLNFADGTGNSHYGWQFAHYFHPSPNGSWTNYGANTSYSMRSGWSNFNGTDEQADWLAGNPIKMRVGIDDNGFISIETLRDGSTWEVHARTSYPVAQGSEFRLGIKFNDSAARLHTLPKVHLLEPAAPTMYFRVVESPDNVFNYPVFATTEEAEYYDDNNGGTGTYTSIVFPDDPTFTTWYIPTNGYVNNGTEIPTADTFLGNPVAYTEITTLTNADLAPAAFSDTTMTVNELSAVNIQLHPTDASYVTSIDANGSGLTLDVNGIHLNGTAPEVLQDYDANPSDSYTIYVIRTNAYGSSTGTLTLVVTNLTAPVTAISGFNHVSGTTAMVDSDTMGDGSVVHVNGQVADGERFVIEKAYVEANILPSLNATDDKYIIGLANQPETFSTLELSDFDTAIVWEYESSTSHTFKFYRDGSVVNNIVISSLTQAFYDYAIEVDGTSAWLIACNINSIMNEPSPSEGGTFSHTYEATSIEDTAPVKIHIAVLNTTADISTDDIETITTPTPAPTNSTDWNKALDFSGSNEYLKHNTWVNANKMPLSIEAGLYISNNSNSLYTANSTSGRPWATTIVFKADGNNSRQTIWNSGEGFFSSSDNFGLEIDSNDTLWFYWSNGVNSTSSANRCYVQIGIDTSKWYGVYIAHKGGRFSSANATQANLGDAFDIRVMSSADSFTSISPNRSASNSGGNWQQTGRRMDKTVNGRYTIGGSTTGTQSFYGKVASSVITTLKNNSLAPVEAEIKTMITDPIKWENDYKQGSTYRKANLNSTEAVPSAVSVTYNYATQIHLMGDSVGIYPYSNSDAYPNIFNKLRWVTATRMEMQSMVSNDIENVSISGLT